MSNLTNFIRLFNEIKRKSTCLWNFFFPSDIELFAKFKIGCLATKSTTKTRSGGQTLNFAKKSFDTFGTN